MTAAGLAGVDLGKLGVGEQGEVVGDGGPFRPVDFQSRGLQSAQRAAADAADDDGVGRRIPEGAQRAALAVGVVEVTVADRRDARGVGVDQQEQGGGSEVAVDGAFQAFVGGNGEQILVVWLFSVNVHMHNTSASGSRQEKFYKILIFTLMFGSARS